MPFNFNNLDCSPLVVDNEFEIANEDLLAEFVGMIILGQYVHVKKIIRTLAGSTYTVPDNDIDVAIARLDSKGKTTKDIEKRDGWLFQIISWLALFTENKDQNFYCQQPHDAPAQHGIDGIALVLNKKMSIDKIIITEDKCTENHRVLIPEVWEEFALFEGGHYNNKIVSRISAMLENMDSGKILEANKNEIYSKKLWQYRVGINRNSTYETIKGRNKLFKGYDGCVAGSKPHRRYAATINREDIRLWMESFSKKVISYLESKK